MPRSWNGEATAKETLLLIKERQRAKVNNATAGDGQPAKNVISGTKKSPPPSPGQNKNTESSPGKKTTPPASPGENATPTSVLFVIFKCFMYLFIVVYQLGVGTRQ